jgi:hypothetical protein
MALADYCIPPNRMTETAYGIGSTEAIDAPQDPDAVRRCHVAICSHSEGVIRQIPTNNRGRRTVGEWTGESDGSSRWLLEGQSKASNGRWQTS